MPHTTKQTGTRTSASTDTRSLQSKAAFQPYPKLQFSTQMPVPWLIFTASCAPGRMQQQPPQNATTLSATASTGKMQQCSRGPAAPCALLTLNRHIRPHLHAAVPRHGLAPGGRFPGGKVGADARHSHSAVQEGVARRAWEARVPMAAAAAGNGCGSAAAPAPACSPHYRGKRTCLLLQHR